jgi:tetratricopeptide (TPR) repeat protein
VPKRRGLADLLAEWQELLSRGGEPDREAFLAAHPESAAALREHLDCLPLVDLAFAPPIRIPATIGPYRIQQRLGAGAMGTVYLAEMGPSCACGGRGTKVALKILHAHLPALPGFLDRFQREAGLGGRVIHENVVRTLRSDSATVGTRTVHFLVTEYVEGRTLRELLGHLGAVPEALLREVARQIAAGLAAIHDAGIVHRDLKPENVIVTRDHRIRVMDLGLARPFDGPSIPALRGSFAGTLLYAAPEHLDGGEVGPPADLYSLGVLIYELASGANPFRRDRPAEVRAAHLGFVPAPLDEAAPGTSAFLAAVVAGLLGKSPATRLGPAAAVATLLERGEHDPWWTGREARGAGVVARRPKVPVRRETGLVGRGEDLAALRAAWEKARAGEGSSFFLEGEPGIGKTRLMDAFLAELAGQDAWLLYGSYAPSGGAGALSEAVIGQFGEEALPETFRRLLPGDERAIEDLVAVVLNRGVSSGGEAVPLSSVHDLSVRLLRALSLVRPVLLVVEDLHFADPTSRDLLVSLCRGVQGHRVLVALTARPGVPEAELAPFALLPGCARRRIPRLSAPEVTELLREAFGNVALARRLGGRIAERSGGVPYFVFEMIRALHDERVIVPRADGSFVEGGPIPEIGVPVSVRDLIVARLTGLSRAERAILDVAAVEGYRFDPDLVARVLGQPRVEVLESLGRLERHAGVVRTDGAGGRFDHHLIQEVLHAALPSDRREEVHERLAEVFVGREGLAGRGPEEITGEAAVFLAGHGLRGRHPERGLPFLATALDLLSGTFRSEDAAALAALALDRPGLLAGAARARVLLARAHALGLLGRGAEQGVHVREASELAEASGDPTLAGVAACHLGSWHGDESRWDEAEPAFRRAIAHARRSGDAEVEGRARMALGHTFRHYGRLDEARVEYEAALGIARASGLGSIEGRAEQNLGVLLGMQARYTEALDRVVRSRAICRAAGDREGERGALWLLGLHKVFMGEHAAARTLLEESLRMARALGVRHGEASVMLVVGLSHLQCGEFVKAGDQLERCLALRRELRDRTGESVVAGHLGHLHFALGRYEEAVRCFRVQIDIARETREQVGEAMASAFLGPVIAACGDMPEARRLLAASAVACRELSLRRVEGYVTHGLAIVAAQEGDVEEALRLFGEALDIRRGIDYTPGIAATLCARGGLLAGAGRVEEARPCLVEALGIGRRLDAHETIVLSLCHLARLPGGDAAAAEAELRAREDRLGVPARMEAWYRLHAVTAEPGALAKARALLSHVVEHAPAAARQAILSQVALHREIAAASSGGG